MKLHVKRASFSTDNSRTSRNFPFFTLFLTTKSLSQTFSITLLQISRKLHEHWGDYWRKKLLWMILEEQFPVPRNNSVSKIGNSVISLLWQLRCQCNPNHNKFSSLSNTSVVAIFPKLCLWRRSLWSNLEGIGPEKLYRATLINVLFIYLHVCLHNPPREPLLLAGCVQFYCITRVLKWSKVVVSCCATFVQDIRKNVLLNT